MSSPIDRDTVQVNPQRGREGVISERLIPERIDGGNGTRHAGLIVIKVEDIHGDLDVLAEDLAVKHDAQMRHHGADSFLEPTGAV
ncbi:hypothetical protein D9M72_449930 [compost metagenome]